MITILFAFSLLGIRILCFNCKSTKDHVVLLTCIAQHTKILPFDYIFFTPNRIKSYEQKQNSDKSNILSYSPEAVVSGPLADQVVSRSDE